MNQEKKVFLLILSLIVLIILCVYTHLEKITSSQSIAVAKPEATEEKVELKEEQEEERVLPSTKPVSLETNKEESSSEEQVSTQTSTEENTSEKTSQNKIQTEVSTLESSKEEINKEKDIQEETQNIVEEVQEEPLLTTDTRYIRESDEKRIEELSKDTQLLQIKINDYIKNNPIIFRKGTKITNSSIKSIKTISEFLKESPNIRIEIAGHTDAAGAKKLNQVISLERAKIIKNRLVKDGINENRMIVRGYGEDIPLVKNSPKGYSKINRRVEFNIVEE